MPGSKQNGRELKNLLREVRIFRNLPESHLVQLTQNLKTFAIDRDFPVILKSEESTDLYVVLKGKVKVSFRGQDGGHEFILTDFGAGDFFGEISLIDGKPRSATVQAYEKTLLGVLKRDYLLKTINENPGIAHALLSALADRLRKANETIESLVFLDVRERLVRLLVNSAETGGEMDSSGARIIKKHTHSELASRIGASREAVSKILKALANQGLINEKKGHLFLSGRMFHHAGRR